MAGLQLAGLCLHIVWLVMVFCVGFALFGFGMSLISLIVLIRLFLCWVSFGLGYCG